MIDVSAEILNSGLEDDALFDIAGKQIKDKAIVLNEYQLMQLGALSFTGDTLKILVKSSIAEDITINTDKVKMEQINNNQWCTVTDKKNQWNGTTLLSLRYD